MSTPRRPRCPICLVAVDRQAVFTRFGMEGVIYCSPECVADAIEREEEQRQRVSAPVNDG